MMFSHIFLKPSQRVSMKNKKGRSTESFLAPIQLEFGATQDMHK